MSGPGPMISRREAIAALASTVTVPLLSGCTREPTTDHVHNH